jgi:hypothetical protein
VPLIGDRVAHARRRCEAGESDKQAYDRSSLHSAGHVVFGHRRILNDSGDLLRAGAILRSERNGDAECSETRGI